MGELAAQHRLGVGLELLGRSSRSTNHFTGHDAYASSAEADHVARALTSAEHARRRAAGRAAGSGAPRLRAARRARAASRSVGASAAVEAGGAERAALHALRGARSEAVEDVVDEQRAHARLALVVGRVPAERRAARSGGDDAA